MKSYSLGQFLNFCHEQKPAEKYENQMWDDGDTSRSAGSGWFWIPQREQLAFAKSPAIWTGVPSVWI